MKTKSFLIISTLAAALQFAPLSFAQTPDGQDYGPHRRHGRHSHFLANLTTAERAQLHAAREKAMADPAVQAAKDRKRQAAREFRQLQRERMLQADPTIQPILDKIPTRKHRGGG